MLLVSLRLLLMCCCVLWRCWGVLIPYLAPDQVRARGGTKEAACALQQLGTGITDNHHATPPSSSCTQLSSAQAGLENNTVISHTVLSLIHHGAGKNFSRIIFGKQWAQRPPPTHLHISTLLSLSAAITCHYLSNTNILAKTNSELWRVQTLEFMRRGWEVGGSIPI